MNSAPSTHAKAEGLKAQTARILLIEQAEEDLLQGHLDSFNIGIAKESNAQRLSFAQGPMIHVHKPVLIGLALQQAGLVVDERPGMDVHLQFRIELC